MTRMRERKFRYTHRLVEGPAGTQRRLRVAVEPFPERPAPVLERLEGTAGCGGRHDFII